MAYATASDIASEFKNLEISATTTITTDEVNEFADQISKMIDSYVGKRYLVPLTSGSNPISFSILKMICIQLVANRVKGILRIRTGSEKLDQETRASLPTNNQLKDYLGQIASGDVLLSDAELASSDAGFASYSLANNIEGFFDTKKQQW